MTTAADNALAPPPGSLRAALSVASNGDLINFAPSLAGQTIALQGAAFPSLAITKNVAITGGGIPGIVISGSNAATVFTVSSGVTATIDQLTISNGLAQPTAPGGPALGGGILNDGTLTISACTIAHNHTAAVSSEDGAGIANRGTLTIVNSTIAFNALSPNANPNSSFGAGIYSMGTLSLSSCTVADNDAATGYGGGLSVQGTSTLQNSIVSGDTGAGDQPDINGPITNAFNNLLCCYNPNTYTSPSFTNGSANQYVAAELDPAGLQNNGGATQTIAEEASSPSIDAGNPAYLTNPPFTGAPFVDQRGLPRVVNTRMDIGAFQVQTSTYFAAGTDAGLPTTITIYDSSNVAIGSFNPFAGTGFMGGVRLALGDVNGDGIPDLIVGSGRGGIGVVLVYDGASVLTNPMAPTLIRAFMPYGNTFTGGVFVAAGNLDGGAVDEIITGADGGGGPQVNIYSATQIMANNLSGPATAFYAYPFANGVYFTGGVRVASGDVNGDGKADLITAAGPGGGPQVNVYFGTAGGGFLAGAGTLFPVPSLAFFALGPTLANYSGGIYVTAMDANHDGHADLFFGAGTNSTEVTLFSGAQLSGPAPNLSPLTAFLVPAYAGFNQPGYPGFTVTCGVRVGSALAVGNASPVLLTAPGPGGEQQVSEFDAQAIFDNPGVPPGTTMTNHLPGPGWDNGMFVSVM